MTQPSRNGVIAGGNFITDFVKVIDEWPAQDTLATIRHETMSNGGGPYNVLKDLSKLDPELRLEACGIVGNDPNGKWILDDCHTSQIVTEQLHTTDEASTSYTDAMTVAPSGRRTFFHQRGANQLLGPEHFDFKRSNAKIFLLGYLMLLDRLDELDSHGRPLAATVLKDAKSHGLITAVDCVSTPNPNFSNIVHGCLHSLDILFINEYEIGMVLGRAVDATAKSLESAAQALAARCPNPNTKIVVHSESAAVSASGTGQSVAQPSLNLPTSRIKGANGAGDAFAAGFLLGFHRELAIETCLKYAVCSAAMSLTATSPSGGLGPIANCLTLESEYGYLPL